MNWKKTDILNVLDECAKSFTFPALDNGYVYLAATKLSIYRSTDDWAMVIEVFGFSPRSGVPDTHIYTFASRLNNRQCQSDFANATAFDNYKKNNPYNESRFIYPIDNEEWICKEDPEFINDNSFILRGQEFSSFPIGFYADFQIELEEETPKVFEFCRLLAAYKRELVLATEEERRGNVLPEMKLLIEIDEWVHPDIIGGQLPSKIESFQQLAEVLEFGDIALYCTSQKPNTHWSNWPEGGAL